MPLRPLLQSKRTSTLFLRPRVIEPCYSPWNSELDPSPRWSSNHPRKSTFGHPFLSDPTEHTDWTRFLCSSEQFQEFSNPTIKGPSCRHDHLWDSRQCNNKKQKEQAGGKSCYNVQPPNSKQNSRSANRLWSWNRKCLPRSGEFWKLTKSWMTSRSHPPAVPRHIEEASFPLRHSSSQDADRNSCN